MQKAYLPILPFLNCARGLKDKNPELFAITAQEQINKLTLQLATSFVKWLIE